MKINMSYGVRDTRINKYVSIPKPTVSNLTELVTQLAWVAEQPAPRVRILES